MDKNFSSRGPYRLKPTTLGKLFSEYMPLSGSDMLLRRITPSDAGDILSIYSDTAQFTYTPGLRVTSLKRAVTVIEGFDWRFKLHLGAMWGMEVCGHIVGAIEAMLEQDSVLVGYIVDPAHKNKGIATKALGLVTRYLLYELGFPMVLAKVDKDNLPSIRVLEKCGFEKTAQGKDGLLIYRIIQAPK